MRRILLAAVAVLFAASAFAAPRVERFVLPPDTRNDAPALSADSDGSLWAAWPSLQDGRFRLAVARMAAGELSPIEHPDPSPVDQLEPAWFVEDGSPALLYTTQGPVDSMVHKLNWRDGHWSSPVELGRGMHPTAVDAKGVAWMAWQEEDGIRVMPGNRLLSPSAPDEKWMHPCLATAGGRVWLAWHTMYPGGSDVLLRRLDALDAPIQYANQSLGMHRHPRLTVDAQGRAWIVWEALYPERQLSTRDMSGAQAYLMDLALRLQLPARTVRITDGTRWWKPPEPVQPALGLHGNLLVDSRGTLWMVANRYRDFPPVCEHLDARGWTNHRTAWGTSHQYKSNKPLVEATDGTVWTAWMENTRRHTGSMGAPSWTILDGTDTLVLASMPRAEGGMPVLTPIDAPEPQRIDLPELPRYSSRVNGENLLVYFGDLHQHSEYSGCGRWNGRVDENQEYSDHVRGIDFMCTSDHAEHLNAHNWRSQQMAAARNSREGEFIVYTGYEWTSEFDHDYNLHRGHYNIVYRDPFSEGGFHSASDLASNTPLKLWNALRGSVGAAGAFTFAHHTSRRMAWLSWNYYDPEMAPLIEIAQVRGSYEYEGCPSGQLMSGDSTRIRGHYIHDGLARGMRWGIVANGDHGGRQITAVFAPELSRNAIFDAMQQKRAYGTNGEQMFLDARVDGRFMGEEYTASGSTAREIIIRATGTTPLVQVDLFRNGRSIRQWFPNQMGATIRWTDPEPLYERENSYYVRAQQQGGGLAWSSPTWLVNSEAPGAFRFQVGGDELRVIYPDKPLDVSILMHNETSAAVAGKVVLELPEGWSTEPREIAVKCAAGGWEHAVFMVTAPETDTLALPPVVARFNGTDGAVQRSSLRMVHSPIWLSRERKAMISDALTEIAPERRAGYLATMEAEWKRENP